MSVSDFAARRVVVTGGAGFIGSHLVAALHRAGAMVRVLDDFSSGSSQNLAAVAQSVEVLTGDIRDPDRCHEACEGADLVFHLAALGSVPRSLADPGASIAVNVAGTAHVFAAARAAGVRRVVYASSSSVYGDSRKIPKREGEEGRPLSPYALSKRMNEDLGRLFGDCFGLETVGLRFFNVYGPRQNPDGPYAAVIPRFFAELLAGRPATFFGDGLQRRDFTYVDDAVAAALAAAAAPSRATGAAYNVGNGRGTTLQELELAIRQRVGGGPPPVSAPERPGDVRDSVAATESAWRELGFRAEVGLLQGLDACLKFYTAERGGIPVDAATPIGAAASRRPEAPRPGAG